jgi:hypothetical protein
LFFSFCALQYSYVTLFVLPGGCTHFSPLLFCVQRAAT